MTVKSMFRTRTFWFNIASACVEIVQLAGLPLGIPPGTVTLITNVGNIILRRITDKPASFSAPVTPPTVN